MNQNGTKLSLIDRKHELEQKKAKLEEIKNRKLQRLNATNVKSTIKPNDLNIDELINSLQLNDNTITTVITPSRSSTFSSENVFYTENNRKLNLAIDNVNTIDIASKEVIQYTKETQTAAASEKLRNLQNDDSQLNSSRNNSLDKSLPLESYDGPFIYDTLQWEDEFHLNSSIDSVHDTAFHNAIVNTANDFDYEDLVNYCLDIDKKEDKIVINHKHVATYNEQSLVEFLKRATIIIENALNEEDIFFDYAISNKSEEKLMFNGEAIKLKREFYDDRWKNRIITCIDWSTQCPELILTSYASSNTIAQDDLDDDDDSDGLVVLWNLKNTKNTPECILTCSSWVTSCCFNDFNPNLVIAGTYSGQIVMWDTRSNKQTPVQRSSFSTISHTNPIYCINVIGTQNANNLISISNDGRLCIWSLDNMNTPIDTIDLQLKQTSVIPCTCMDFKLSDENNFIIGTEDAYVYLINRNGSKTGINEIFEGHYGPITSISFNKSKNTDFDFSNIFLTSSFDWTMKLWNLSESTTPIYSFEDNTDYIYDVAWSPIHPSIFACVDGSGRLDLWNLLNDVESSTASFKVNDGLYALNKLKWSKCGLQIACGDDHGRLSVLDINECVVKPKNDDFNLFNKCLNEMKDNYIELQNINADSSYTF